MAVTLTASVKVQMTATQNSTGDLGMVKSTPLPCPGLVRSFANGVGVSQANVCFADTRTLAQSAVEDLDLIGGGLLDISGDTFAPARIKVLWMRNNSVASTLQVGGDAASIPLFGAAADYIIFQPGEEKLLICVTTAAGLPVTADTGDIIQVTHGGEDAADLTYDIVIIGGKT